MKYKIGDIINQNNIIYNAKFNNKTEALEYISELFCKQSNNLDNPDLNKSNILNYFLEREKLGSTTIGYGIAIPHCRISNITQPMACIITLANSIKFNYNNIIDNQVRLIFSLIVPENNHKQHLELLAQIAELLKNNILRESLFMAKSSSEIYKAIKWNY